MCFIRTEPLDTDHPVIRKGYDLFAGKGVAVPLPFRMLSASSGLFDLMIQRNRYYGSHPRLSFSLLAHIRYFVSVRLGFDFCRRHNGNYLERLGLSRADIREMGTDPARAFLPEDERQMAAFVLRAMAAPDAVQQDDIDELRRLGWTDTDIFDALAQGAGMRDHHLFIQVFKPEHPG